jgi:maleylpyruvate isomerase
MSATAAERARLNTRLEWMREGTALLLAQVDRLSDADVAAPCPLPGWTRAHLLAHLARNADALHNLVTWARTGVETPMYTDLAQRNRDIEHGAAAAPGQLRKDIRSTAEQLEQAVTELSEDTWSATVRSALGREILATEIPWLRIREVWIHLIDLDTGATFADLPDGLVDALLEDVTAGLGNKESTPGLLLRPTDRAVTWDVAAAAEPTAVTGRAADLLGWLLGRTRGEALEPGPDSLPGLPAWL